MSPAELHADSIVIDGLIIAKWNRELFEDMRKGGLTAANCTVSVWEGFQATVNNIAASQKPNNTSATSNANRPSPEPIQKPRRR